MHKDKSKIFSLANGAQFLGYRVFYNYKLLRKSNLRKFQKNLEKKLNDYNLDIISSDSLWQSLEGWFGYAMWANTYKFRKKVIMKVKELENNI